MCLAANVKQYIKDSLSCQNSIFTLSKLASLEKKLAKHFQVKDFLSLEQGNFLDFLVKHIQVSIIFCLFTVGKQELSKCGFCFNCVEAPRVCVCACVQLLQDSVGFSVILGAGTIELSGNGFRPTKQDVFEFINQCGDIPSTDSDEVSHF